MKTTVYQHDFWEAFRKICPDNFSYEGLQALFNYFEDYEDQTGEEIELDVIAICCDFTEYESLEEFQGEYGEEYETIEDIENSTLVIPIDDERFIIQVF